MNDRYNHIDMNCVNCNFRSEMFNKLTLEELELICRNKSTIMFRKGETIRKQGTTMTHVISVISGMVKIYLEGPNKTQTILRIVKPTNFIGGPGIFLDQTHHYSVSALLDSTICFIDIHVFRSTLSQNKLFSEEFMKDFSTKILLVYQRLINHSQKGIPGKMADTLLYLQENIYGSNRFKIHLSKQDLADISGMSKDSCVKILRKFKKEGVISFDRNELGIIDLVKLERISRLG